MTRITDEAVDAALNVLFDHGHNGIKCYNPQSGLDATVRAALEAALPHLEGATPSREEIAEALHDALEPDCERRHVMYADGQLGTLADAVMGLIGGAS